MEKEAEKGSRCQIFRIPPSLAWFITDSQIHPGACLLQSLHPVSSTATVVSAHVLPGQRSNAVGIQPNHQTSSCARSSTCCWARTVTLPTALSTVPYTSAHDQSVLSGNQLCASSSFLVHHSPLLARGRSGCCTAWRPQRSCCRVQVSREGVPVFLRFSYCIAKELPHIFGNVDEDEVLDRPLTPSFEPAIEFDSISESSSFDLDQSVESSTHADEDFTDYEQPRSYDSCCFGSSEPLPLIRDISCGR